MSFSKRVLATGTVQWANIRVLSSLETGQVKTVHVEEEVTAGGVMERLGYRDSTLRSPDGDFDLSLECTFKGRGDYRLVGFDDSEMKPYLLGGAE